MMTTQKKRKTRTKKNMPKKSKKADLSELEQNALDKWKSSYKERAGPPKFKKIKDKTITHVEQNPDKFRHQIMETVGSLDVNFFKTIIDQVCATFQKDDSAEISNSIAALMHGLGPRDETEGILIAQMTGTHNLIMKNMMRAAFPEQFLEAGNDYTNRAYKLMNIFLKQIETLQKYRGKAAQQKVIVEHVYIGEGGKAVVGHFEDKSGGGRGDYGAK